MGTGLIGQSIGHKAQRQHAWQHIGSIAVDTYRYRLTFGFGVGS
jgi:hypothetical protein